jgi:hypothetical protein
MMKRHVSGRRSCPIPGSGYKPFCLADVAAGGERETREGE